MSGRRWAYGCALLGGAASIAANIAHSWVPPAHASAGWTPPVGAVIASVFWPVALLAAIEAFARVPWPAGWRYALLRFGGLLPVALVAAVVSYLHLSGLLLSYNAGWFEVHVGPLAVDGLMVIGTSALIATGRRTPEVRTACADLPPSKDPKFRQSLAELPAPAAPAGVPNGVPAKTPPAATKVARAHARHPDLTHAELARKAGVSARTVARYRPAAVVSSNGNAPTEGGG